MGKDFKQKLVKILLLEVCFIFLATTFQSDRQSGWVQQQIPRPDLAIRDMQFLDSLTGFIISAKSSLDTAFIFKTINGGTNWTTTKFDSLNLYCLDFVNVNTGYTAGATPGLGIVKKTTNSGLKWYTVSSLSFISIKDIEFVNAETGWICHNSAVNGGVWRTTNGGENWQMQLNADKYCSKLFFVNSQTGWAICNGGANLYKTTNSGVNWGLQYYFQNTIDDIFFISSDTGWIIGGGGNGLMGTINGGNNWYANNTPIITTGTKLFILKNLFGWAGSGLHKIFATKDGINWGTQYSPIYSSYNVSFVDTLTGWAGAGGLAHTTDGGGVILSSGNETQDIPKDFSLSQNYPNPFNQSTIISYQLSKAAEIEIILYNITGKKIYTIVNERKQTGKYDIRFDGHNLTSGIYFYTMYADGKLINTKKFILLK